MHPLKILLMTALSVGLAGLPGISQPAALAADKVSIHEAQQLAMVCTRQAARYLPDDAARTQLRARIAAAIQAADVMPDAPMIQEIDDTLGRQARSWAAGRSMSDGDHFSQSAQYMVYQRLTTPELDASMRQTLSDQRQELLAIMAELPERLNEEFGFRGELADRLAAECKIAQAHYRSLLESRFLRISQLPAAPARHEKRKQDMELELERLMNVLRDELRDEPIRRGAMDPQERRYRTTRLFLTSFYGMAIRNFVLQRVLDIQEDSPYPLGRIGAHGIRYNLNDSWIFKVKLEESPL